MLFAEVDALHLKKWIVHRLENTSDADADVLADYVLALLRHDGDMATVRRLCEEEIPDFLKEDSSVFVSDVFDAIQYKSYLPGAPLPPTQDATIDALQAGLFIPSGPAYGNVGMGGLLRGSSNGSRKRTYNEHRGNDFYGVEGFQPGGDMNGRVFKQTRRGGNTGRGGHFDLQGNAGRGWQGQQPSSMNLPAIPLPGFPAMPPMPSPPLGMPPLDPNNPMAAMLAMQAMGFPVPGMPGLPQGASPGGQPRSPAGGFPTLPKKRPRCRDYDQKGLCARGNTCMFDHGNDSIYTTFSNDEYDPSNSSIMTGIESTSRAIMSGSPASNYRPRGGDRGRGSGRGDRGASLSSPGRRGGRADFSSDRPNFDKTKTAIVVENIPEDKFSEDAVREFFSEFGTLVTIDMRPYKRLAIITYDDWAAAKAAYSSPKVIFDNRFVKVYWFTDADSLPKPPQVGSGNGIARNVNGSSNRNGTHTPVPARATEEPQIDIEEFARKQQEVQKAHEEKMRKKADMENAQKELEKRQEDLLKNQADEKRKLLEKLAAKRGIKGDSNIKTENADGKPASQTEALKAQLAALEAEAMSLGLDPAASDDSWSGRGRARGRGEYRSIHRGRGAFVPRGRGYDIGGFRGRGGAPFGGGGNVYRLDNRPKKVALAGVDFTDPDKDESLRQYLLGIGEFTDIDTTPERTSITFKDRFTAEKFMFGTVNGEIPAAGKVEMAWVQTPSLPVNLNNGPAMSAGQDVGNSKMDDIMDTPMHDTVQSHSGGDGGQGQERQQDLDYDVADDDWGIS